MRPLSSSNAGVFAASTAPRPEIELVQPLRAVVINYDPDIRELTVELLTAHGHQVQTAQDGPSGLALICEHRPDVALVDLGLPGLDGCALARAFRERCPDAKTRLVAMTGFGQDSDHQRARASGFDRHIVKPVGKSDAARRAERRRSDDARRVTKTRRAARRAVDGRGQPRPRVIPPRRLRRAPLYRNPPWIRRRRACA